MSPMNYNVYDPSGNFVLCAPLATLRQIFRLQEGALNRIVAEAVDGKSCDIFFNGKSNPVNLPMVYVRAAFSPLDILQK